MKPRASAERHVADFTDRRDMQRPGYAAGASTGEAESVPKPLAASPWKLIQVDVL
jgi:hypothetical protein